MLAPQVHAALTQLLQALSAPDNDIRSQAEEQLSTEWVGRQPDVLLMGLVEQIQEASDPSVSTVEVVLPYRQLAIKLTKSPHGHIL